MARMMRTWMMRMTATTPPVTATMTMANDAHKGIHDVE